MKFTSNIGKEELLSVYSLSIAESEKKMMIAILGLGIDPDEFELSDLDEIESGLLESDVESRDKINVIKKLSALIDMANAKIEAL